MRVETHNALMNPTDVTATRLVVRDSFGQPLLLAIEVGPEAVLIWKRNEPGFERALRQYGVSFTSVDTTVVDVKPGDIRIGN